MPVFEAPIVQFLQLCRGQDQRDALSSLQIFVSHDAYSAQIVLYGQRYRKAHNVLYTQ
jgi:hypothetical protein